ncbi:MAG: cation:proton antiporter [Muribaculaceae bacterium]|nr:cation:proton antiporter [Muribaculaceae bacterium]
MEIQSLITDLAFILLLGAVVTILFKWIKQPVVLGYIVAGFLASPNFEYLPSVNTEENIEFWAEIGIVVLLFSLGLEFSFKKLINSGGSAAVTALIIVSGMMGAGFMVGHFMGFSMINCLFLGGMLSMSSTTIIIKAFNDLGLRQKKFTSLVLAVLIVEDLFAVVMMVLLSSIAINNSVQGGQLLFSVAKLVFFLVIWFLVGVFVLPSLFNSWRRFLNSETLLVVSMGLCLGMAVFSVYCGFSLALGAFVMGSILAGTSYAERIEHVVTPIKDLFGAVFFISVGMMVQPSIIAQYWVPILILSAVVVVGMIFFGTFGMLITGQSLRVSIESGFSLTQIGEFAFIIATLGMSLGVLNPTIYPIVVAVSVLTTFGTPYFIKMAPGTCNWLEKHLPRRVLRVIDGYRSEATKSNATERTWLVVLKRSLWSTMLYIIILIAILIVSHQYLMPWLSRVLPAWDRLVSTAITLTAMSPFLLALLMPVTMPRTGQPEHRRARAYVPVIVMTVFRVLIAMALVAAMVMWHYSAVVGLVVAGVSLLLIGVVFGRKIKVQLAQIESKFLDNLNERDLRRSGKKNSVVNDLHLAYMTIGSGCKFAGQRLMDSNLRARYGVNVVSIQRGADLIPVPSGMARTFPGDVIGVIGNDEQISALLPVVEREKQPEAGVIDPLDFKLTSILLSESSPLIGKTPVTAKLRDNYDVLVVAVQRGEEYIDSDPKLMFAPGDIVWLVGNVKALPKLN